nr:hypothetical protein [uncultured Mucilaginibacter sp.]
MLLRTIFSLFFLTLVITSKAQNVVNHTVEPVGEYKNIDLSKEMKIIENLMDPKNKQKEALMESVQFSANNYTPGLLYILSAALFADEKKDKAMFWFYVAQLRARYDANRCVDKTASAARYNSIIGLPINEYALANLDVLKRTIDSVVTYVRLNEENYDQRWINMEGMGAFTSTVDKTSAERPLSLPKEQWPAIKTATIKEYYDGFIEAMASLARKQK